MTGYQPLPKTCDEAFVAINEDVEDKDEYEYVIEKGCFPKDRKVLSKFILALLWLLTGFTYIINYPPVYVLTNSIHNNRIKTHSRVDP